MTIEERLDLLERELYRHKLHKRLLSAVVIFLAGIIVGPAALDRIAPQAQAQAAGASREIHTGAIFLEDQDGTPRAMLGIDKPGPVLILFDKESGPAIALAVDKDGPALRLWGDNGRSAVLSVSDEGPDLSMFDENGKNRVRLSAVQDGPGLALYDGKGTGRATLSVLGDNPFFGLFDQRILRFCAGKVSAKSISGSTVNYPESSLVLFGPDGNVAWSATK